ncbi:c-type cytochrome [Effusibacillus dendaii]|uniref:Cytochrome c domain-containing protein n=1 Tax=Effusibacillus dendaii TaxID=2743772 RepID=A0A7I8DE54_9BACL|nr:cytochrome c [Effusibacillus dendaii]BCJ88478.1 hypothetical protein skT53_34630 [Effusibacillus dendaii]
MEQEKNQTRNEEDVFKYYGDTEEINDIPVKETRVPKFLKATYVILAGWAAYYALTATTIDDRSKATTPVQVTAEAGKEIFNTTCTGCHAVTSQRIVGPGLLGVEQRLGDQGLDTVLHNGRPEKGMPNPTSLGLNEDQIQAVKLYLQTLK